jgi:hypothetical protein
MRALAPLAAELGVALDYVDIDADPALVARYDEDVPVLLLDGVEVCRHRFDEAAARRGSQAALTRPRRVQAAGGSGRRGRARARRPPQITARQGLFG